MPPNVPMPRLLDVRKLLADDEHPVPVLMQSLATLAPGQTLVLVTPFLPSPLIISLQSQGYAARPERQPDGSWHTLLSRR